MILDDEAAIRKNLMAIEATETGAMLFGEDSKLDDFNKGCCHVCALLRDARLLYFSESYPTSLFLSVTAIEEIAKVEIALYRSSERTLPAKRRNDDDLFSHKSKHSIALQEVITSGFRLRAAIGELRVRELLDMTNTGEMVKLRETALYVENVDGKFICPKDRIGKSLSREFLLLALEVWDDRLVGYTNHTNALDCEMADLFDKVAAS